MATDWVGVKSHEDNLVQRGRDNVKIHVFNVMLENFFHIEHAIPDREMARTRRWSINRVNLIQFAGVFSKTRVGNHIKE